MDARLIIVPTVDSTNLALRQSHRTFADGTLFCALEQTAGRGRLNRRWVTQPGSAVCASALFKEIREPYHAGAVIALAALEVIKKHLGNDTAFFKWPNDIYIGQKKLAGILSEGVIEKGNFAAIISGVGININQSRETLDTLDNPATSLFCESGKNFDISQLYHELFDALTRVYAGYRTDPGDILKQWRNANRLLGKNLDAVRPDGTVLHGKFINIADDGAMLLECDHEVLRFDCGDIKIKPDSL